MVANVVRWWTIGEPDRGDCPWCGELFRFEVMEAWLEDRAFVFDACCEVAHEAGLEELRDASRATWVALLRDAGLSVRSVAPDCTGWRMDYGLTLAPIAWAEAKAFVLEHHRHNRPPAGWRWGHAVYNGGDLVGVALVGRPVARRLDPTQVVEVNRCCVLESDPAAIVWNACSMLYAAAAREAKRRGFSRIVTYTLESERGTTLRAAGWSPTTTTRGGSWDRAGRRRTDQAATCPKVRWERQL